MGYYDYTIEYSADGKAWQLYDSGKNADAKEWPVKHIKDISARYLRLTIHSSKADPKRAGLWELIVN
jgi:hypothetical protein